jgi:hypothetical protein
MANFVESLTLETNGDATARRYCEFDPEIDGPSLAEAMLKEYGTREVCLEEMIYMTIIAASKDDRTTLNGLACLRKYWRSL